MKRMILGVNRLAGSPTCAGVAVVVGIAMVSSAQAQGPIMPSGGGSQVDPYQITQLGNLVWLGDNVGSSAGKYYTMQNDIDASSTAGWNGGAGLTPIGTEVEDAPLDPFMGTFNGSGKVISGLTVTPINIENGVALFGCVGSNGVVKNVGLTGCDVSGNGADGVACLAGGNYGTLSGCYAEGSVSGSEAIGGLVGGNNGTVTGCYANVEVTGLGQIGGLVGQNEGVLRACYATGSATATGVDIIPENTVGGLIGSSWTGGTVSDCYATGTAMGSNYVAGLMGYSGGSGSVIRCYATGPVLGGITVGGLVATNEDTVVSDSYWDTQTSGQTASAGGTGKTTAQMKQQATFVGWDFTNVWRIAENVSYPYFAMPPRLAAPEMGAGATFVLRWCSVTNHSYTVHYSTDLLSGFSVLQGGIIATPPDNTYTDNVTGVNAKFWKVSAEH